MSGGTSTFTCWICSKPCDLADCEIDESGRAVHRACHLLRLLSPGDFATAKPPRHECVIYDGAPSRTLSALAAAARQKLEDDYRCFCLNTPAMIAGMNCYLAAKGVDVSAEVNKGRLVLSAEQTHLVDGHFDTDAMIDALEAATEQALRDGFKGLFATGDMSWEFGPHKNFSKILEYEWRLEQLFHRQPNLYGICQYHRDTLPPEVMRQGLLSHRSIFVNDTLSRINPQYVFQVSQDRIATPSALDVIISELCNAVVH